MKALIEIGIVIDDEINNRTLKLINKNIKKVLIENEIIVNGILITY